MERCVKCKEKTLVQGIYPIVYELGEFRAELKGAGLKCMTCEMIYYTPEESRALDHLLAAAIAKAGVPGGAAFRFVRKYLKYSGVELARLLDVTPETLSRWENGALELPAWARALLAWLALDAMAHRTDAMDVLGRLREKAA